jgi:sugar fermentation stimulation protein A
MFLKEHFETSMKAYKFKEKLEQGLIKSRPNRFIMMVKLGNKTLKCHCPSTGRIGDLVFKDIPCLLSKANNDKRKTNHTVEAISLNPINKKNKKWVGINQVKINKYIEFFLKNNQFPRMIKTKNNVEREKALGHSRIDFLIDHHYLEIKMPLISLPTKKELTYQKPTKFNSFDRLIKHFNDLSKNLKNKSRAIIALCYMYNARPFKAPITDKTNFRVKKAAGQAIKRGVEQWQINLKIDKNGVAPINYFRLKLF